MKFLSTYRAFIAHFRLKIRKLKQKRRIENTENKGKLKTVDVRSQEEESKQYRVRPF